ncbi:PP2C family protein-serine/threonine phosphatase [Pilimelia columellifera]|uniref:PP2C family protein-serine/threonine phosphatase n=1 Tax=Pilimelia columellifera subsp. columellifera TaxID=706583 RepID=A0ABN3NCW7_9ACTN
MDPLLRINQNMINAPAHLLVEALADGLRTEFDASGIELLLADYQLVCLMPVLAPDHGQESLSAGPAAACFTSQRPHDTEDADGRWRLHLPVSVRGDRLGVLRMTLPGTPDSALAARLLLLTDGFAHLLAACDRVTDRYVLLRRVRRLTLASEMQWSLLPGRGHSRDDFDFAGQLEPAYAVRGDNFDWSRNDDEFTFTVTNGMGEGLEAAVLTTVAIHGLRNARRAGLGLAEQASLADQALYSRHRGEMNVASLLLQVTLSTGEVSMVDAGSPMVLRLTGDDVAPVSLRRQPPLGAFDDTEYTEQRLRLLPGDRLIVLSDGATDLTDGAGVRYSERAMRHALRRSRNSSALDTVRTILSDLLTYFGRSPLDDDAVVTCFDWHGPQRGARR